MMKAKKVLLLVHQSLIPPIKATVKEKESALWRTEYDVSSTLKQSGYEVKIVGLMSDLMILREAIETFRPHIIFNLLEEFDGHAIFDQNVVSYLQLLRQAYTGCSPAGLMLSRDKGLSKKILAYHRIAVPKFSVAVLGRPFHLSRQLRFPLIVKGLNEEGSLGISQASVTHDEERLTERVEFIHQQLQCDAIIEEFIEGREFYVSLLGNQQIRVLPVRELSFNNAPNSFHKIATARVKWNSDYREKYGIDTHLANLSESEIKDLTHICRRTFRALQLDGYARIDLRQDSQGKFYVIEANPNPDISAGEDFALAAQDFGWTYQQLLDKIIKIGLRKSWLR